MHAVANAYRMRTPFAINKTEPNMKQYVTPAPFRYRFAFCSLLITLVVMVDVGFAQTIRLNPTHDTWVSSVGEEANGANGGSPRMKLKSIQELSLIDFDFASLSGKKVRRATLHLKQSGDEPLDRMAISTVAASWVEGTSQNYEIADGQSTFSYQKYPGTRWGDNDITAVTLGAGNTIWRSMSHRGVSDDGWMEFDVPVELVQYCVAGLSYGWLLMDDTGSTWTRNQDEFKFRLYPNRFIYSRDSNSSYSPYLTVELDGTDSAPPVASTPGRLIEPTTHDPRYFVSVPRVADALGVRVWANNEEIPLYLLPASEPNALDDSKSEWRFPIDPLLPPWPLESSATLKVVYVDNAGNQSSPVQWSVKPFASQNIKAALKPANESIAKIPTANAPIDWSGTAKFGKSSVAIIDPLDKINSEGTKLIPANRANYLAANVLWNAKDRSISLSSSRGQWVGFQMVVRSPSPNTRSQLVSAENLPWPIECYRFANVNASEDKLPDPLLLVHSGTLPVSDTQMLDTSDADLNFASWLFEIYVPEDAHAGDTSLDLELLSGNDKLAIKVKLSVAKSVIPKRLSFLPEMNCYNLPNNERDYYRMAHRHRVVLNRVPYYQRGEMAEGLAPTIEAGQWLWEAWDKRFGQYFSGEAFADLPRGKTPMECFYLPMHENWPLPIEPNYNGSYWADEAFTEEYRDAWVNAVERFAKHLDERRWNETRFHVFLNNKVDFKKRGWSYGSSPWLLDEPANFQDFVALRYFGKAYRDGMAKANSSSKLMYRCDISRPQWQRTALDGLLQYNVVSQDAFRRYERLVLDRKYRDQQTVVVYGTSNPISASNVHGVAWSWDNWCHGADGVLPWQTIGRADSWDKADELALFYPNRNDASLPPDASIRLKAYCYGQQDVELLSLVWREAAKKMPIDRYRWGKSIRESIGLKSVLRTKGEYNEDAGWYDYGAITPETFESWRRQLRAEYDRLVGN